MTDAAERRLEYELYCREILGCEPDAEDDEPVRRWDPEDDARFEAEVLQPYEQELARKRPSSTPVVIRVARPVARARARRARRTTRRGPPRAADRERPPRPPLLEAAA